MTEHLTAAAAGSQHRGQQADAARPRVPRWPLIFLFAGFPLWWVLGVVDLVWIPVAVVMALYLAATTEVRAPRGYGVWLTFLVWVAASVIMISGAGDLIGFTYRYLIYVSAAVLFLYVYNGRADLTARFVSGVMTAWWGIVVGFGYLSLAFPDAVLRTPLSMVLPSGLLSNDLVNHMVVRRLTQFNPDSFLQVAPRPSAPFLFTNNWGNAYSLLLPFVIVYLLEVRRERRFLPLLLLLLASCVPAFLTLNRGMFLGIGVAAVYATVRLVMMRRFWAIAALGGMVVVGAALYVVLPVQERLDNRLSTSAEATSNDTRASLYVQALQLVPQSPVFGFGGPVTGDNPDAAPVGTQGQIWMLLVSHGVVATACFVLFFLIALGRTLRRRDRFGLASSTALLVGVMELFYYGVVPNGLPILMLAAALGMRGPDDPPAPPPTHAQADAQPDARPEVRSDARPARPAVLGAGVGRNRRGAADLG